MRTDPKAQQLLAADQAPGPTDGADPVTTADAAPLLHELLAKPSRAASANLRGRVDGIAVGTLQSLGGQGMVTVSITALGLSDVAARSIVPLDHLQAGAELALGFEAGDPLRPIVLGAMVARQAVQLVADGQHQVIECSQTLELRCGEASILMLADGRIELRGTYITSHASATQRIRGGSVQIN